MNVENKLHRTVDVMRHLLPEGDETLDELETRARAAGYTHLVRETGGLLISYHCECLKEPE